MTSPAAMIAEDLDRFRHDPLGFVRYAYPWGKQGTSLARLAGPQQWAVDVFEHIRESLTADPYKPILIAVASGKGITKSATASQLAQWAMCTFSDCRGMVTANTEQQLMTKTWPEFTKWYQLLICKRWFRLSKTALVNATEEHSETWKFDRVTWSEHNPEAAQGLHNQGKRIIALFDESSRIADTMWSATEDIQTDKETEIIWAAFGNPTRNFGRFAQCFTTDKKYWYTMQVDSRTTTVANMAYIQTLVEKYGEDSDEVKVKVRGLFPSRAANQLIAMADIERAAVIEPQSTHRDALVIGIDCAREGDDDTVIRQRRGRDARTYASLHLPKANGFAVAEAVSRIVNGHMQAGHHVDAIFVDCTGGYGWSVYDALTALGFSPIACNFAEKAVRPGLANMRMQIYADLEQAIASGLAIPNEQQLKEDLAAQMYTHDKLGRQILIDKDDIKVEIGRSPDDSDALALTYWAPVITRAQEEASRNRGYAPRQQSMTEYEPLTGQ